MKKKQIISENKNVRVEQSDVFWTQIQLSNLQE